MGVCLVKVTAWVGQAWAQAPHPVHVSVSIIGWARPPSARRNRIAVVSHTSSQARQAMPCMDRHSAPTLARQSIAIGAEAFSAPSEHASLQAPQKVQAPRAKSITARRSSSRPMICSGHASAHRPHPVHNSTKSATAVGGRIASSPRRSKRPRMKLRRVAAAARTCSDLLADRRNVSTRIARLRASLGQRMTSPSKGLPTWP